MSNGRVRDDQRRHLDRRADHLHRRPQTATPSGIRSPWRPRRPRPLPSSTGSSSSAPSPSPASKRRRTTARSRSSTCSKPRSCRPRRPSRPSQRHAVRHLRRHDLSQRLPQPPDPRRRHALAAGIDPATEAWWASTETSGRSGWTPPASKPLCVTPYNLSSDSGTDRVDAIFTNNYGFEFYESTLTPQVRYTDTAKANLGFQNLMFKNVPMFWDFQAPASDGTATDLDASAFSSGSTRSTSA